MYWMVISFKLVYIALNLSPLTTTIPFKLVYNWLELRAVRDFNRERRTIESQEHGIIP